MGWEYNSHIVCTCIIMRWSRNRSASWAERFRNSSLLCTYKLYDYYTPIPILSPFLFTPSLYVAILNLQDFSFTCNYIQPGAEVKHVGGQTVHAFKAGEHCVPYSIGALSWGIYPHKACVSTRGKVSYLSRVYTKLLLGS